MLSESIRLQLADTSVKIVELEPPSVRTSLLPGFLCQAGLGEH